MKLTRRASLSLLAGAGLFLTGFGLTGCGQSGGDGANNAAPATSGASGTGASGSGEAGGKGLKVALLTPGDINDVGWSQLAYEGLQAVKKETGASIANQVTKNAADQKPAMVDFAEQGYDIVFCHGNEYGDRALEIADQYPNTKFIIVAGTVNKAPNVISLIPKLEDATYLLGMAAAGASKSGTIGEIGGLKLAVITSTFDAYQQGARAVNPNIKVLTNYINSFEDQNTAKEATNAMIAQGADVIFHNADQAGKGMFKAAQESRNVLVFGSNRNQNDLAPDVCLASGVMEIPKAFAEIAKSVQDKSFKPENVELNLAKGTIMVEWNDKLKSRVPAPVIKKIEEAQKQIAAGTLKIKRNA